MNTKTYNQQIGELIRNGQTIYYAFIHGMYVEHQNREEIEAWIWAEYK